MGRDPSGEPKISTAVDFRREITQPILALYETVAATPMPVIAIVGGHAQGFGCALASARGITIASSLISVVLSSRPA